MCNLGTFLSFLHIGEVIAQLTFTQMKTLNFWKSASMLGLLTSGFSCLFFLITILILNSLNEL